MTVFGIGDHIAATAAPGAGGNGERTAPHWPPLRTVGGNWDQEEGSAEVVDELVDLLGLLEDEAFSC